MSKPYVICHMMVSLDGKIDGDFFNDERAEAIGDIYETIRQDIADAWGNGSVTHQMYFGTEEVDFTAYQGKKVTYEDKVIIDDAPYAVCFDRLGKVNWAGKYVDHPEGRPNRVLEVLSRKVRPEYVAYLDELEIPYIFAGEEAIDLTVAMNKLYELFHIKRFALCGGSKINGAFLAAGLLDELSLVVAPFVDGHVSAKTFIERPESTWLPERFKLKAANVLPDDGVQLVYVKEQ